jgi:hypothetical protein
MPKVAKSVGLQSVLGKHLSGINYQTPGTP